MIVRNIAIIRGIGLIETEFSQLMINKYLVKPNSLAGFFPLVYKKNARAQTGYGADVYRLINNIQLQLMILSKDGTSSPVINPTQRLLEAMKASLNIGMQKNRNQTEHINLQDRLEIRQQNERILERIIVSIVPLQSMHERLEAVYSKYLGIQRIHTRKVFLEVLEKYIGNYPTVIKAGGYETGQSPMTEMKAAMSGTPGKDSTAIRQFDPYQVMKHMGNRELSTQLIQERFEKILILLSEKGLLEVNDLKDGIIRALSSQTRQELALEYTSRVTKRTVDKAAYEEEVNRKVVYESQKILRQTQEINGYGLFESKSSLIKNIEIRNRDETNSIKMSTPEFNTKRDGLGHRTIAAVRLKDMFERIQLNKVLEQVLVAKEKLSAEELLSIYPAADRTESTTYRESAWGINTQQPFIMQKPDNIFNRLSRVILEVEEIQARSEGIYNRQIYNRQYMPNRISFEVLEKLFKEYEGLGSREVPELAKTNRVTDVFAGKKGSRRASNKDLSAIHRQELLYRTEKEQKTEASTTLVRERKEVFLKELVRRGFADVKKIYKIRGYIHREIQQGAKVSDLIPILDIKKIRSEEKKIRELIEASSTSEYQKSLMLRGKALYEKEEAALRLKEGIERVKANAFFETALISKKMFAWDEDSASKEMLNIFDKESYFSISMQDKPEIRRSSGVVLRHAAKAVEIFKDVSEGYAEVFNQRVRSQKFIKSKVLLEVIEKNVISKKDSLIKEADLRQVFEVTQEADKGESGIGIRGKAFNTDKEQKIRRIALHRENRIAYPDFIHARSEAILKELVRKGLVQVSQIREELFLSLSVETREELKNIENSMGKIRFSTSEYVRQGIKENVRREVIEESREISDRLVETFNRIKLDAMLMEFNKSGMDANIRRVYFEDPILIAIERALNKESVLSISTRQHPRAQQVTSEILKRMVEAVTPAEGIQERLKGVYLRQIHARNPNAGRALKEGLERYLTQYSDMLSHDNSGKATADKTSRTLPQNVVISESSRVRQYFIHPSSETVIKELVRRGLLDLNSLRAELRSALSEETRAELKSFVDSKSAIKMNLREKISKQITLDSEELERIHRYNSRLLEDKSEEFNEKLTTDIKKTHQKIEELNEILEIGRRKLSQQEFPSGRGSSQVSKEIADRLALTFSHIKLNQVISQVNASNENIALEREYAGDNILDVIGIALGKLSPWNVSTKQKLFSRQWTNGVLNRMVKAITPVDAILGSLEKVYNKQIYSRNYNISRAVQEIFESLINMKNGAIITELVKRGFVTEKNINKNIYKSLGKKTREEIDEIFKNSSIRDSSEAAYGGKEVTLRLKEIIDRVTVNQLLEKALTEKVTVQEENEDRSFDRDIKLFTRDVTLNTGVLRISEMRQSINQGFERIMHSLTPVSVLRQENQNAGSALEVNRLSSIVKGIANVYDEPTVMNVKKDHSTGEDKKSDALEERKKTDEVISTAVEEKVDFQQKEISPVELKRIIEKVISEVERRAKFDRQRKGLK